MLRRFDRLSDRLVGIRVLVAGASADALVAARAERPAAVLRARPVAREQDDADARVLPGDVERAVELVDGVRAERVAHLGAVEGDARDAAVRGHVRGDVGVAPSAPGAGIHSSRRRAPKR